MASEEENIRNSSLITGLGPLVKKQISMTPLPRGIFNYTDNNEIYTSPPPAPKKKKKPK
jgi:hypothetical protein